MMEEKMHQNEIYIKAVETFGIDRQIDKCIEELAELTNELVKSRQGRSTHEKIIDEITDAEIVVNQMKWYFGYLECETHKIIKLERLKRRIQDETNKRDHSDYQ